ncbi:MAG: LysE family translocator [Fibrobacter sp.]|jgi:threonine/homoserine/homoserine lactone efflux protein|nr:LysE family translocator [Fibrobacter sp.]
MPLEVMIAFSVASLLLALSPGPDNLFVLVHSALYGPKSGIIVIAGLCTGLLFHTTIVALGITTLFKNYPMAFVLLKVTGALYLLFLSWNSFRASVKRTENQQQRKITGFHLYRRGVIMNVTNPKVSIFFLAFLPQFTSDDYGPLLSQFFILGALFIFSTFLVFGAISLFSSLLCKLINGSELAQKIMNWIAGTVFAGIALKLVVTGL